MPVTVIPSKNAAEDFAEHRETGLHVTSRERLLFTIASDDGGMPDMSKKIIQSSFDDLSRDNSTVFASKNGLVFTAMEAYNQHHRLVLRPDDVWIAILSQLSIYVNANAEALRHLFVAHEGQRELRIEVATLVGLDHGKMAFEMTKLMADSMKDATLRDWVLPAFTTTAKTDQTVAAIIFMGSMQKYFTYSWGSKCGLPSATLLGEADDWALIRERCEQRLGGGGFGPGAQRWWQQALRPVLDGFITSFVSPTGSAARRFWQGIVDVHSPNGSGATSYSGWITAFCYWDENGVCLHESKTGPVGGLFGGVGARRVQLLRSEVPMGFAKVPVMLFEGLKLTPTEMLAGLVGTRAIKSKDSAALAAVAASAASATASAPAKSGNAGRGSASGGRWSGYDTIQPEVGWFMYKVPAPESPK